MNLSQSQINVRRIPVETTHSESRLHSFEPPVHSLRSIFAEKSGAYIRKTPVLRLFKQSLGLLIFALISIILISPAAGRSIVWFVASGGGAIVPKIALAWCVVRFWRRIVYFPRRVRNAVQRLRNRQNTIDGIPVGELVDYLVRNQHFKREGVNGVRATFGLNMEKFNRLAANLEKSGVLKRGENNSRVLGDRWNRQTLFDLLDGKKRSSEVSGGLFKVRGIEKVRVDNAEIEKSESHETPARVTLNEL